MNGESFERSECEVEAFNRYGPLHGHVVDQAPTQRADGLVGHWGHRSWMRFARFSFSRQETPSCHENVKFRDFRQVKYPGIGVSRSHRDGILTSFLLSFCLLFSMLSLPSVSLAQSAAMGVRCVAILDTGSPLVIRMKDYSQAKCEKAATTCLKGRSAKEIKYFDTVVALTLPTPMGLVGLASFPEVCDAEQFAQLGSAAQLPLGSAVSNGTAGTAATSNSGKIQQLPNIERLSDYIENIVFEEEQNLVTGIVYKGSISYGFPGYLGGGNGFANLLFDSQKLNILSHFGKPLYVSNDPLHSDVIAILTDGEMLSGGFLAKNRQLTILRLFGLTPAPQIDWKEQAIFDGACFLSRLYRNGQVERTVAWINLSRVGSWILNNTNRLKL